MKEKESRTSVRLCLCVLFVCWVVGGNGVCWMDSVVVVGAKVSGGRQRVEDISLAFRLFCFWVLAFSTLLGFLSF